MMVSVARPTEHNIVILVLVDRGCQEEFEDTKGVIRIRISKNMNYSCLNVELVVIVSINYGINDKFNLIINSRR
jgi:hypothetical protein